MSRKLPRICYGYELNGATWSVNAEQAKVVALIFDKYLESCSLRKIADLLFELKIESPRGKPSWTPVTLDKILDNSKYVPFIISERKFFDVQNMKAERGKSVYKRTKTMDKYSLIEDALHTFPIGDMQDDLNMI